ncbi:DHH family phosphoesterase [Patescibacteria group bacterium]|nr:DHH family phosphoesterase [Patescibacteria group bacterium]
MSQKVKQLAPAIWDEIQKANKILMHLHRGPDPDSAGSALALYLLCKNLGKQVTIIAGDSIFPESMKILPGSAEIVQKNYFQIKPEEFDLLFSLDSSTLSQISKEGEIIFPPKLRTVKIDHHRNEADFANINLVDTTYPAAGQIVYDLMRQWKAEITPDIAANLFAAIYSDTGGFKYPPTNADTLLAGSELARIYPDYFKIIFALENSKTPKQLEFLGLALSSVEHYFNNKVAIAAVSYDALQKHGIAKDDTKNLELSNTLKSVTGWIIGVSMLETLPGTVEFSIRKREYEGPDLSKVAIALGGGGHSAAAGCSITAPFADARKLFLQKMVEVYPELGKP